MGTFNKKASYELSNYTYENEVLTSDFSCKKSILIPSEVVSINGQFYKTDETKTYIGNFDVAKDGDDYRITTSQIPYSMISAVNDAIEEIIDEMTK